MRALKELDIAAYNTLGLLVAPKTRSTTENITCFVCFALLHALCVALCFVL
jgi:hypothetical protein